MGFARRGSSDGRLRMSIAYFSRSTSARPGASKKSSSRSFSKSFVSFDPRTRRGRLPPEGLDNLPVTRCELPVLRVAGFVEQANDVRAAHVLDLVDAEQDRCYVMLSSPLLDVGLHG